jgi:dihydromonapterin reductase/dihydrofolate reductase
MPSSAAPILITGGAQRIGLHCALRLLESGQPVIVSYRSEREGLAELRERGAITLAADFSSEAGLSMCFAPIIKVNGIRPALIQLNPDDSDEYRANRLSESALGIEPEA